MSQTFSSNGLADKAQLRARAALKAVKEFMSCRRGCVAVPRQSSE